MKLARLCVVQIALGVLSLVTYSFYAVQNLLEFVEDGNIMAFNSFLFDFYGSIALAVFVLLTGHILAKKVYGAEQALRDPYGFFLGIKNAIMLCYALIVIPVTRVLVAIPSDIACAADKQCQTTTVDDFIADVLMALLNTTMLGIQVYMLRRYDINTDNAEHYPERLRDTRSRNESRRLVPKGGSVNSDGISTL